MLFPYHDQTQTEILSSSWWIGITSCTRSFSLTSWQVQESSPKFCQFIHCIQGWHMQTVPPWCFASVGRVEWVFTSLPRREEECFIQTCIPFILYTALTKWWASIFTIRRGPLDFLSWLNGPLSQLSTGTKACRPVHHLDHSIPSVRLGLPSFSWQTTIFFLIWYLLFFTMIFLPAKDLILQWDLSLGLIFLVA